MVYKTLSELITTFDYERKGFDIRVGYPVLPYTRAFLTYSFKDTDIRNVKVVTIDAEKESGIASGVEASLVRDKRNNSFEPTGGYWASVSTEYVGIGGDFNWIKPEIEGRYYKNLIGDLVLRSRVRVSQLLKIVIVSYLVLKNFPWVDHVI